MNVVYISPHFPPSNAQFCLALKSMGARVLGLGDEAYDTLRPELKAALAEYYRVDSLLDDDQVVRAMGYFTHRHGRLHRVESHNEYWLRTEAGLREDFNLPGPRPRDLDSLLKRSRMKALFRQAGVPTCRGELATDPDQALILARRWGYPLIAKPDQGMGASAVLRLPDEEALAAFFRNKPQGDYLLEEYMDGELWSFDGLAGRDGRAVFTAALCFGSGILEVARGERDLFYHTCRKVPDELDRLGRKVLSALDIRERFFHIEFFRTQKGDFLALDANPRPPIGLSTDMFNYANDIDMYREWARVLTRGSFEACPSWPFFCGYAGRRFSRDYALSHEEILSRYRGLVIHHEHMFSVFSRVLGDYGYLLRSPDLEQVKAAARDILA